jgi:hypothetical protein
MQKKPNILFIMADDIGWFNVSAYNHGLMGYRTPNIDLVAGASASRLSNSQPRSVLLNPRPFKAWSRDNFSNDTSRHSCRGPGIARLAATS